MLVARKSTKLHKDFQFHECDYIRTCELVSVVT